MTKRGMTIRTRLPNPKTIQYPQVTVAFSVSFIFPAQTKTKQQKKNRVKQIVNSLSFFLSFLVMVFGDGKIVGYDLDQAATSSSAMLFLRDKYPAVIGKVSFSPRPLPLSLLPFPSPSTINQSLFFSGVNKTNDQLVRDKENQSIAGKKSDHFSNAIACVQCEICDNGSGFFIFYF